MEEFEISPPVVCVKKSRKIPGYGVFAKVNIKKGKIIETCPLVLVPISELEYIKKTKLNFYYFEYNSKFIVMSLGYGSLYNHSYTPNAKYVFNYKEKLIKIYALRNIRVNDEIFINYNYDPDDKTSLKKWYDPNLKVIR